MHFTNEYFIDNTPMFDAPQIRNCKHCKRLGKEAYICALKRYGKVYRTMFPCSYLQQLICQRAIKKEG